MKAPTLDGDLRRGRLPEAEDALNEILDLIADAVADRLLEEVRTEEMAAASDGAEAVALAVTAPSTIDVGGTR